MSINSWITALSPFGRTYVLLFRHDFLLERYLPPICSSDALELSIGVFQSRTG